MNNSNIDGKRIDDELLLLDTIEKKTYWNMNKEAKCDNFTTSYISLFIDSSTQINKFVKYADVDAAKNPNSIHLFRQFCQFSLRMSTEYPK